MKRTALVIAASLGVALDLGCHILDTEPLGTLTDQTFYQTEKDFDAATLAPYSTMLNLTYDQNGMGWWDGFLLPDDNVQYRDPNRDNDVFNWSATNLFTLTPYRGLDPEFTTSIDYSRSLNGIQQQAGTDRGSTPQPRTFQVGVTTSF